MKRIAALPNEIGTALDSMVRKQARGRGDDGALITARAVLIAELIPKLDAALYEAVQELRDLGMSWRETAQLLGLRSANAAEQRFNKTLTERREYQKRTLSLKTPVGLEGITVTAAGEQAHLSPSMVHKLIEANLDNAEAQWFIRTPASTVRGYVDRITDVEGLIRAKASWDLVPAGLEGILVSEAARKAELRPATVRKLIEVNLNNSKAKWFIRTPASTKKGYVDRITDVEGLIRAKASWDALPVREKTAGRRD